jgi:DNA-directed RNA polymerase beta subunit
VLARDIEICIHTMRSLSSLDIQAKPRQLHNTHWGMICPAETPEGQVSHIVYTTSYFINITVLLREDVFIAILTLRQYDALVNAVLRYT